MEIFPAIDIMGGACVRLRKGDFADATVYEKDPLIMAQKLRASGARWLHVVDLDGAKAGRMRQRDVLASLARSSGLSVEVGGGIRSTEDVENLLDSGVARVVVGSLALRDPEKVRGWLRSFGASKIVLAMDVREEQDAVFEVLTHGWQQGSAQTLDDALGHYEVCEGLTVLCTDVSRDGMLTGPNLSLYRHIQANHPAFAILASGGVSGPQDLAALAALNVAGVIVGKAMYEGRVDIAEALRLYGKETPCLPNA